MQVGIGSDYVNVTEVSPASAKPLAPNLPHARPHD